MLEAITKIKPDLIQSSCLKKLGWEEKSEVAVHVYALIDGLEQF